MLALSVIKRASNITRRALISSLAPATWPYIGGAVLVSGLAIAALWGLCAWFINWGISGFIAWQWLITTLQGAAALTLAWMLFPLLIPAFISMFVNLLATSIERREYPEKTPGTDQPFWPELKQDMGFTAYALLLNLLVLPLYFIPLINVILYWALNGHLLGKQYYMMVARRHVGIKGVKASARGHRWLIYSLGVMIALCSTVPFANLIAPAFATALMVHAYSNLRSR